MPVPLGVWKQRPAHDRRPRIREVEDKAKTKLLADGLTALTKARRKLDANIERVDPQVLSSPVRWHLEGMRRLLLRRRRGRRFCRFLPSLTGPGRADAHL
jgi:hypothetical protein